MSFTIDQFVFDDSGFRFSRFSGIHAKVIITETLLKDINKNLIFQNTFMQ